MFKKEMGQWIFKINKYLGMHYKQIKKNLQTLSNTKTIKKIQNSTLKETGCQRRSCFEMRARLSLDLNQSWRAKVN